MKASIVAASVALAGTVAAAHNAHAGFHVRRHGYAADEVCTVYTTVYVTACTCFQCGNSQRWLIFGSCRTFERE